MQRSRADRRAADEAADTRRAGTGRVDRRSRADARGSGPGARPPARGGALRPRRQHRQRRVPDPAARRPRARVRGGGRRRRGRRSGARPGDRVVVPFQISCGECARCRRGQTGDCESVPRLSMYGFGAFGGNWGGASSDVVRVPYADAMLVPLPDGLEPATVASASDNIPDAWRTVAPPLERASRRRGAGGRRWRAQHRALCRGHGAGPRRGQGGLRRRPTSPAASREELGAETVEGDSARPHRAVPDHGQREPHARGPPLRDPLDRARRRLHVRRRSRRSPRRRCRCSRCTRTGSSSGSAA